ncbi:MAG: helix-turn-helix domain-containing protein [Gemmatimonadota bacterium]|nr:helix-turn-helix domain-containing protein [Gemmatimonadota bacterium]
MMESDHTAAVAYERQILVTEGPHHVGGAYFAVEHVVERQRRRAGERMVRESQRREAFDRAATVGDRARVGTWLISRERARVDAAASGQLDLTHRETLHALRVDLAAGRIGAVLVSAALIRLPDIPTLSALVRDFPSNPVVGFVAEAEEAQALAGALAFGQAGVAVLVDARSAAGWSALRSAFDGRRLADPFMQRAVRELTGSASGTTGDVACTAGWVRFLAAAFSPRVTSAKQVASSLGVVCSTLTSRFYRAGLPSPKRYIGHARLVWAARLGETPGLSISAIAHRLDASSPQSFGRTVRTMLGVTAADFRRQFNGEAMLARFRAEFVEPYRETVRIFDPLTVSQAEREQVRRKRSTHRGLTIAGRAA